MTYAVVIVIKRLNYIIIYLIINIQPIDPGKKTLGTHEMSNAQNKFCFHANSI